MEPLPSHPATIQTNLECGVCCEEFSIFDGVVTCVDHFYCNDCALQVIQRSLGNLQEFPASCCARTRDGIPLHLFEYVLDEEIMNRYNMRLEEHETPPGERIYCSQPSCSLFIPESRVTQLLDSVAFATCTCRTKTCAYCKDKWDPNHICPEEDETGRPAWLPAYSPDSRTKQCPNCLRWIQLSEACNHMTCAVCKYEFCFVCLLEWRRAHQADGCPLYGDPTKGYDDEGYERDTRSLHLYSGRDREGYDRRGVDDEGRYRDGRMALPEPGSPDNDEEGGGGGGVQLNYDELFAQGFDAARDRQIQEELEDIIDNVIQAEIDDELIQNVGDLLAWEIWVRERLLQQQRDLAVGNEE